MKARTVVLTAALVLAAGDLSAFEGKISVRSRVTLDAGSAHLGDVAELEGSAANLAGLQLIDRLAPAETRRLDGYELLQRLRNAGVDLERVAYDIPASVAVTRTFQKASPEVIARAVSAYLKRNEKQLADAVIRRIDYQKPIRLPIGHYEVGVRGVSGSVRRTRLRLVLDFRQGRRLLKEVPATVELSAHGQVYCVRRALRRSEIISAADLVSRKWELSALPPGVITEAKQAIGLAAARLLRPDIPLMLSDLTPPVAVKRGDPVTLLFETHNMRITARGMAREDGTVGKEIKVVNRESGKEILGKVANASTVLVEF